MVAFRRKRTGRMARRVRRRAPMRMTRRVTSRNFVSVKRTYHAGALILGTTWLGQSYNFVLQSLPNYTDFTNAFDAYRILAVKMMFIPTITSIDGEAGTTTRQVPRLYTAIDKTGNPQTSSENSMLEYGNLRIIKNPLSPFSIYVRHPAVWQGVATASSVAYSEPRGGAWLSCDSVNIPHYGTVIGGIHASGTTGVSYNILVTYYMQFKQPR